MYSATDGYRNSRGSAGSRRRLPAQFSEEEDASDYEGTINENDFEMIGQRRGPGSVRNSRRPEVSKIRVKVHADEVKLIMIKPDTRFETLSDKVRDKFNIKRRFRTHHLERCRIVSSGFQACRSGCVNAQPNEETSPLSLLLLCVSLGKAYTRQRS